MTQHIQNLHSSTLKRILFLNRSFYPDVEATGQLLAELCEELVKGFEVHVICGNPLYRKVKKKGLIRKTYYKNIIVWRINNTRLPKKFFLTRFINLLSYYIPCALWVFFLKRMNCIIAETDPPLLALIAYTYSRIRNCPFIYYSQDIWPYVGIVNEKLTNPLIIKMLKTVNNFLYKKAAKIIVPGRDMKVRLQDKILVSPKKIEIVENWVDPDKIYPIKRENNLFIRKHSCGNKFIVMYSGNIGLSQDLENIIPLADSLRKFNDILFVLIGEGAYKEKLINMSVSRGLSNIKFLTYQDKEKLRFSLSAAHIHLIPLKKEMKGYIVPSKVYGIMAAGKPFIAAVDEWSEIDRIVKEFQCGIVIEPSNVGELREAVLWAFNNREKIEIMGQKGRQALENYYSKKICTQKFKKIITQVLTAKSQI